MKILFVNACVHPESRTHRLANYLLNYMDGEIKEINLNNLNIPPLNKETLMFRSDLVNEKNFNEPVFEYARCYANSDVIVVAAPYWDLSFPSALKVYIEHINIPGIVFEYDKNGKPEGLCKAKKLIYITTAGGKIVSDDYGFGYIKELAQKFHGIKDVEYIKAEGLDIDGAEVEEILQKAEEKIDKLCKNC